MIQQLKAELLRESLARRQLQEELDKQQAAHQTSDPCRQQQKQHAEEVEVALEAISSLHQLFISPDDPGHHILDTLEQCISVILERSSITAVLDTNNDRQPKTSEMLRLTHDNSTDSGGINRLTEDDTMSNSTTKIIYFMPRSATPFMTNVCLPVGQVRLADFKVAFDRPGFYRYYTKNTDTEYGMVKEEVSFFLLSEETFTSIVKMDICKIFMSCFVYKNLTKKQS